MLQVSRHSESKGKTKDHEVHPRGLCGTYHKSGRQDFSFCKVILGWK